MTITELLDKIEKKAKEFRFKATRNYKANHKSSYPYEELIVKNEKYPNFLFLVHKNMIFERNSISDTSYDVFTFDMNGNYIKKESVEELGHDFFRDMKVIKKV